MRPFKSPDAPARPLSGACKYMKVVTPYTGIWLKFDGSALIPEDMIWGKGRRTAGRNHSTR